MKTKLALLAAALAPLTLSAQNQPPPAGGAAAGGVAPTTVKAPASAPTRLARVQFQDTTLPEIIEYLQTKAQEMGLDPESNPLNVVITPGFGIEEKRVPSISLRNVSPTEVLTVVTTVLGLHLEPVAGDSGTPVAWLVKAAADQGSFGAAAGGEGGAVAGGEIGAAAGGAIIGAVAGTGAAPASNHTPPPSGTSVGIIGGEPTALRAVEIASSAPVGGSGFGTTAAKQVRVFGIAQLINIKSGNREEQAKAREQKYNQLVDTLAAMSHDQSGKPADVKFYEAMDIIVVKTPDPTAMTLISDAIEAMKKNATTGGEEAASRVQENASIRESALRAELESMRGQLKISEAERDMTRRTFTDQIEALKSAQKAQNSDRK